MTKRLVYTDGSSDISKIRNNYDNKMARIFDIREQRQRLRAECEAYWMYRARVNIAARGDITNA